MDLAILADNKVRIKESEKKDKYQDLARELKILWSIKVMLISIVIDALGTISKGLQKGLVDLEIKGQMEII